MKLNGRVNGIVRGLERLGKQRPVEARASEDVRRRFVRSFLSWQLRVFAAAAHDGRFGGDGRRILTLADRIAGELRRQIEAGALSEEAPMAELLENVMTTCGLEEEFRELRTLLYRHGRPGWGPLPLDPAEDPLGFVELE